MMLEQLRIMSKCWNLEDNLTDKFKDLINKLEVWEEDKMKWEIKINHSEATIQRLNIFFNRWENNVKIWLIRIDN